MKQDCVWPRQWELKNAWLEVNRHDGLSNEQELYQDLLSEVYDFSCDYDCEFADYDEVEPLYTLTCNLLEDLNIL